MHGRQTGDRRIDQRHSREKRREAGERRPGAAVLATDQQSPIAGGRQIAKHRLAELPPVVEQRAGLPMPPRNFERVVHHPLNFRRRPDRFGDKQLGRTTAIPNRPMHRAAGRLKPLGEERLDLFIRLVDRSGAPRLFIALAAQAQRGLGKRGVLFRCRLYGLNFGHGQFGRNSFKEMDGCKPREL